MKKFITVFVLGIVIVLSGIIGGCSQKNPSNPDSQPTPTNTATATGLFVERAEIIQPQSSHGVGTGTAYVNLRYGNSTGAYVQGATITIGTGTLNETTAGHYSLGLSNKADGAAISMSISSLAGNGTSSINAPYDGEITFPSTDGGNQSRASTMEIDWRYWAIITGTLPQKVEILVWRSSDNLIAFDQTYTPSANGEYITLAVNTLPNMGQVYVRAYSINQAAIIGANGGSATFRMLNSENTHYVNMIP